MKATVKNIGFGAILPIGAIWLMQVNNLKSDIVDLKARHAFVLDSTVNEKKIVIEKQADHIFKLQVKLELCK